MQLEFGVRIEKVNMIDATIFAKDSLRSIFFHSNP